MSHYVDGYLLPLPKDAAEKYRELATFASKLWMEHGALEYWECIGEDLEAKEMVSFPTLLKTEPDETVVFAFIKFKSRAHRDEVNAKVMADPRMDPEKCKEMPFDFRRMACGGFETIVES